MKNCRRATLIHVGPKIVVNTLKKTTLIRAEREKNVCDA